MRCTIQAIWYTINYIISFDDSNWYVLTTPKTKSYIYDNQNSSNAISIWNRRYLLGVSKVKSTGSISTESSCQWINHSHEINEIPITRVTTIPAPSWLHRRQINPNIPRSHWAPVLRVRTMRGVSTDIKTVRLGKGYLFWIWKPWKTNNTYYK